MAPEMPPAGAATNRANKDQQPETTLKLLIDKTDEDFNNNVLYEALIPTKSNNFNTQSVFIYFSFRSVYGEAKI